MRYDFQLIFAFIGLGLVTKRLSWRGWYAVAVAVFAWIIFNWKRG